MRITGDNDEGKAELDAFIDPESRYPVIVTTSRLMITGIDAQTCKLIVLDRRIQSMTEFKQIIGRGTRINEDYAKYYFTIMDFKKATELFADPAFDGDPVQVYEPGPDEDPVPPDDLDDLPVDGDEAETGDGDVIIHDGPGTGRPTKYYVSDVEVSVVAERVQYYDVGGKLITESLKDYTRKTILKDYASLEDFLERRNAAKRKHTIISELESHGILLDALADDVGKDYDPFDLICHVAFDRPPLTRRERADNVRKRDYFSKYGEKAQAVLDALISKYADQGIIAIEKLDVLRVQPLSDLGTPVELIRAFGDKEEYLQALNELETLLYEAA
jgi:type I restriction enzyme R subunit